MMEFKGDEAEACRLALHVLGFSEPGVGRFFPTQGLVSSVGIPNPPLFIYLVAIPLAIVRSPLAVVAFVAAANVAAIGLCYLLGRRCFSRLVGLAAAGLWALAPWAIVFSRKIWAQDLLPICTTLFALELHAFLVRRRPSSAFGLVALFAVATQLHFSAWVLGPILVVALWLGRDALNWRYLVLGITFAAALYAPFFIDHSGGIVQATHHDTSSHAPALLGRFEAALRYTLAIVGGDRMSILLGHQAQLARPLSIVLGSAALIGIIGAAHAAHEPEQRNLRVLFAAWYLLPLTLLSIVPVHDYIHYFIVITPLPFLGLAYLLEAIIRRRAAIGGTVLALSLVAFVALDIRFFRTVIRDGGAPGEYGVAYRYKAEAAAAILRLNPNRSIAVGLDQRLLPSRRLRDIRFLLWNGRVDTIHLLPARTGYVIVDQLRSFSALPSGPSKSFGPLRLVKVPLQSTSRLARHARGRI